MYQKLKWKCRRGMKELDLLMESYLENDYPTADRNRQVAFERLLDYQDPVILDLLFERIRDEDIEIQSLINLLREYKVAKAGQ